MVTDLHGRSHLIRPQGPPVVESYCEQCQMFTSHQAGTSDGSTVNVCLPCLAEVIVSESLRYLLEGDDASDDWDSEIPGTFPSLAVRSGFGN
jgi:hypothetical protein